MAEFAYGSNVYTLRSLKQKLHEHYKDVLVFAEVVGCGTVLCFKTWQVIITVYLPY